MHYQDIAGGLPEGVQVVGVTKGRSLAEMELLYRSGCRLFGENRINELKEKQQAFTHPIEWHYIGRLQRKMIPKILPLVSLIHSVDSLPIAEKISSCAERMEREPAVLLEVNTAQDPNKAGFPPEECRRVFAALLDLPALQIRGLMTMAPLTKNQQLIRNAFCSLRQLRDELVEEHGLPLPFLSMGMSNDWQIAVEEGATLLRIGNALFQNPRI